MLRPFSTTSPRVTSCMFLFEETTPCVPELLPVHNTAALMRKSIKLIVIVFTEYNSTITYYHIIIYYS